MNEITEVRLGRALFLPITGKLSSKSFSIILYKAVKYIQLYEGVRAENGGCSITKKYGINTHFTFLSFGEKHVPTFSHIIIIHNYIFLNIKLSLRKVKKY